MKLQISVAQELLLAEKITKYLSTTTAAILIGIHQFIQTGCYWKLILAYKFPRKSPLWPSTSSLPHPVPILSGISASVHNYMLSATEAKWRYFEQGPAKSFFLLLYLSCVLIISTAISYFLTHSIKATSFVPIRELIQGLKIFPRAN